MEKCERFYFILEEKGRVLGLSRCSKSFIDDYRKKTCVKSFCFVGALGILLLVRNLILVSWHNTYNRAPRLLAKITV